MGNSWTILSLLALLVSACNATPDAEPRATGDAGTDDDPARGGSTYRVGGTIAGLDDEVTLTLDDEELTVDGEGPFEFETELENGDAYDVEVVAQPDGVFCVVEDGSGRIEGADVEDVSVTCEVGDPGLLGLRFSVGVLDPAFDVERERYRVDVPLWVSTLSLEPVLAAEGTVVHLDDSEYEGEPFPLDLEVGQNTFVVESRTGLGEERSYTLDVYRAASVVEDLYAKARIPGEGALFGFSADVDGGVVVVGAPGDGSASRGVNGNEEQGDALASGAAFVYERGETGWEQTAFIKASNADAEDLFGFDVAVDGDLLVVGAPSEDGGGSGVDAGDDDEAPNAGAAYVYERGEGGWGRVAYLKPEFPGVGDSFGRSVDVSGERIIVGAYFESSDRSGVNPSSHNDALANAGAAHIFERRSGGFTQVAYLKASNTGIGVQFGESVAIDGDTAVVGAMLERSAATSVDGDQTDDSLQSSGAAYVFGYDADDDVWFQDAYLKPSNTKENMRFGNAVSVDGDRVAVGAFTEPSSSTGVDPGIDDTDAPESGAVYVFARREDGWEREAMLKASNSDERDHFGHRVILKDNTLVIGAHLEKGSEGGVEASQADDSAAGAGAVYVFFHGDDGWSQQVYIKPSVAEPGDNFGHGLGFDGVHLVAGAPFEDNALGGLDMEPSPNNALQASGAMYVFR